MKYDRIFKDYLNCSNEDEVFNYLIGNLANTIRVWDYFVNWQKVGLNHSKIEKDLNILNYLVGKDNLSEELAELLEEQPQIVRSFPILIASRDKSFDILTNYKTIPFQYKQYNFNQRKKLTNPQIDDIVEFADNSGILALFENRLVRSLPDYVLGIEVGLDSNGRKNRTGTMMENILSDFLTDICHSLGYPVPLQQVTAQTIQAKWGIKVRVDKNNRKFDFAIKSTNRLYLVETNFYGGGGSKLKATAGEYQKLFNELQVQGFGFIWITDGFGWLSTSNPLRETFNYIDYILNLNMIAKDVLTKILELEL